MLGHSSKSCGHSNLSNNDHPSYHIPSYRTQVSQVQISFRGGQTTFTSSGSLRNHSLLFGTLPVPLRGPCGPLLLCHILSTVHIFLNHTNLFDELYIRLVYNDNPSFLKNLCCSIPYTNQRKQFQKHKSHDNHKIVSRQLMIFLSTSVYGLWVELSPRTCWIDAFLLICTLSRISVLLQGIAEVCCSGWPGPSYAPQAATTT